MKPNLPQNLSDLEQRKQRWQATVADCRESRLSSSTAYKRVLWKMLRSLIPPGSSVLHIGCGEGVALSMLETHRGVGIEPSAVLAEKARINYPNLEIITSPLESLESHGTFDYILLDNVFLDCFDVDELFFGVGKNCHLDTRILLINYSQLWRPILKALRFLGLAKPRFGNTWFSPEDMRAALERCDFEVIYSSPEILFPLDLPLVSRILNRFLSRLPFFRVFCLHHMQVARRKRKADSNLLSVSVVIPARNEAGNVDRLMQEIPDMGSWREIIFVEGNSTDNTYAVLEKAVREKNDHKVRLIRQPGQGKGDAVRAGFAAAKGDILMILDADLAVPAENLPRFYEVIANGHADFANGTRLVYGMDEKAMRFLNLLANHFFAHAFTFVLGQPVRDTLCGTKVLSRKLYEKIANHRSYFGDFDPFGDFDLLFGTARLFGKIVDVPVRYRERVYGTTNISRFKHGVLLFRMLIIAALKLKFR